MKTNSAFFKVSIVHLSAVIIVLALFSSWLFLSAKTEVNKANSSNSEEEKMNTKFKESKTADEKSKDHPYKNFTSKQRYDMFANINNPPANTDATALPWKNLGPYGYLYDRNNQQSKNSGRLTDIEPPAGSRTLRVSAASGGLWLYRILGIISVPFSFGDRLPTSWIGSFCSHPTDTSLVFAGTGEFTTVGGMGLFRTRNLGASWEHIKSMIPEPPAFMKLRFQPGSNHILHAATQTGYYRSIDTGNTWSRTLNYTVTDISFNSLNSNVIFAGVEDDGSNNVGGIYRSTDNGQNWSRFLFGGAPTTNVGFVSISHSVSNPSIIYSKVSKRTDQRLLGIYRTSDGGNSWQNVSPAIIDMGGQGRYASSIGVHPVDPNIVLAGQVPMIRTTNGGFSDNWTLAPTGVHPDIQIISWAGGSSNTVYVGTDGGLHVSYDAGATFSNILNVLPTVQFYSIGTPMNEKLVIAGGTQDNGTPILFNRSGTGLDWYRGTGNDGGDGITIDPASPNNVISTKWPGGGGYSQVRERSNDYMETAVLHNNGIPPNDHWWVSAKNDRSSPVYFYANSGPNCYYSTGINNNWILMNPVPFPHHAVWLEVSAFASGSTTVYCAMLNPSPSLSSKLRVFDGTSWNERSNNLPPGLNVRSVQSSTSILINDWAYLTMKFGDPAKRVFRTTNKGLDWENITGNLPHLEFTGVIEHPYYPNILVTGGIGKLYKTTNSGQTWTPWQSGMPDYIEVSAMTFIDSLQMPSQKFYVVAGTFGRGIWARNIMEDDLVAINNNNETLPEKFGLFQNYPNPFNPVTIIKFSLHKESNVHIKIYDITGKEVIKLIDENMKAGTHHVRFDASKLASGVYFYKLISNEFSETKKMVLIK